MAPKKNTYFTSMHFWSCDLWLKISPRLPLSAGNKMIDLYVILAMPFISFLVVVIYIIEIPSFYFGNAT